MASRRSDEQCLRLFSQRVEALADHRGNRDKTLRSSWSITGRAHVTESNFDVGDSEYVLAVLPYFRQFTAPSEDIHLPRICSLLERGLTDPALRNANRALRHGRVRSTRTAAGPEMQAWGLRIRGV